MCMIQTEAFTFRSEKVPGVGTPGLEQVRAPNPLICSLSLEERERERELQH